VAFDIDGVFADTMRLFLDIAQEEFNINSVQYEDITCYSLKDCINMDPEIIEAVVHKIIDGEYTVPLKPIKGAPQVVAEIASRNSPVLFVTARPYLGPIYNWMKGVLPIQMNDVEVIATGAFEKKADVLLERSITHFVEDRLETCFALEAVGITPVLFKQPWNREKHPFMEVGSWTELASLVAI
jgi:hypothetical protein